MHVSTLVLFQDDPCSTRAWSGIETSHDCDHLLINTDSNDISVGTSFTGMSQNTHTHTHTHIHTCTQSVKDVLTHVEQGNRMDAPDCCSEGIYQIMKDCWDKDARQRPNFVHIAKLLQFESICMSLSY